VTQLRWELADAGPADRLFEGLVERVPGLGEFRGLEFLHVNAKRIINAVKPSPGGGYQLPFSWSINAYRGCSHACSYCVGGDTSILMADGATLPIADVRAGDLVIGTTEVGRYRHFQPTAVLDQWSTTKPAYRVALADGTDLVASADHRFLSDRGWRHVAAGPTGPRPVLTPSRSLAAVSCRAPVPSPGDHLRATVRLTSVEALDVEMPMFDITTGTGDFIANGVVSHNCFARPTHAYLDLDIGAGFDSQIVVKVNAVSRLRAELNPARWCGELIAMGTNTDPYQRAEGRYRLTRGLIEALSERRNPFSILTKSTLVLRDLDLLAAAAKHSDVRVNLSIGTLDDDVWRATEPGTPHPRQRLAAVRRLNDAGVPCGVLIAPVLPGLSDRTDQLEALAAACVDAGARSVSTVLLHLRPGVKGVFLERLAASHPELVPEYERLFPATRVNAPVADRRRVGRIVHAAVRRAGGLPAERMDGSHLVGRAERHAAAPPRPEQLPLL
jgi:DNA repair photolyase